MNKLALIAVVPLLLTAACDEQSPLPNEPQGKVLASMNTEHSTVPIRGAEYFQMNITSPTITCVPVHLGVTIHTRAVGSGRTIHLGESSTADWFDSCVLSATPGVLFTATGHSVTTAASGDQLNSTWSLTQHANGSFVIPSMTITGGTGRFANASGSATGSGHINFANGYGYWEWSGMLTYAGN